MAIERADYNILVVEDTPPMAKLTLMSLERAGFTGTTLAEDGETAIDFLKEQSPHLVLLDLNLPGISGWDVMEYITDTHGANHFPVIVTTAFGDSPNRVVGRLQNVFKYMVKPFSPQDLTSSVETALGIA